MFLLLLSASCGSGNLLGSTVIFEAVGSGWQADAHLLATFDEGARFGSDAVSVTLGVGGGWAPSAQEDFPGRIERKSAAQTEWWQATDNGWEHGFEIAEGGSELVIEVPVTGADLQQTGDRITLRVPGTGGWSYAELSAFDADGAPLVARMHAVGQSVQIHVATAGAAWPVSVDPMLTPATWIDAPTAHVAFGGVVADLGDVNGDGFPDVGISGSSAVYVYQGSASGPVLATTVAASGNNLGHADVNGDGFDDLLVGQTQGGRVFLGSTSGIGSTSAVVTVGGTLENTNVFGVGDVNGDGYDDAVFAQPDEENTLIDQGRVWLHLGAASGLALTSTWSFDGQSAYAAMGGDVGAGDLNGDGFSDVVVGAAYQDGGLGPDAGAVYVFYGSAAGLATAADATLYGSSAGAGLGAALSVLPDSDGDGDDELALPEDGGNTFVYAGASTGIAATATYAVSPRFTQGHSRVLGCDVNGDGFTDLLVSNNQGTGVVSTTGCVQVWAGTGAGFVESTTINGSTGGGLGPETACSDVDADGYDDVLAGESGFVTSGVADGRVLLSYGAEDGPETMATWTESWTFSEARMGPLIQPVGDVNGDGYDDLAVMGGTSHFIFVYAGGSDGLSGPVSTIHGGDSFYGCYQPSHGDFDGDGYDDLLVGSPDHGGGTSVQGAVFLYDGSTSGVNSTASWEKDGGQAYAWFGYSVAGGDFDGDGYADAISGAYQYDLGQSDEGVVFLFDGSATGPASVASWYWEADVADALAGSDVAAGDIDGDGLDDLAIGVPGVNSRAGEVAWFAGGSGGMAFTPDVTVPGSQSGAKCGLAVSVVGDTNGDGYPELGYACPYYDDGETDEGEIVLLAGTGSGPTGELFSWTPDQSNVQATQLSGGDVDGDGYADLILATVGYVVGGTAAGQVWVLPGSSAGPDDSDPFTYTLWGVNEGFGYSAVALDANQNGLDEVYVGMSGAMFEWEATDADGDGVLAFTDCDDGDATTGTSAEEVCDGVDNDCDGTVDEELATWYLDLDGDGFGDLAVSIAACPAPDGYVADNTDCDDSDVGVFPGAGEVPDNGADEDCDGEDAITPAPSDSGGIDSGITDSGAAETGTPPSADTADSADTAATADTATALPEDTGAPASPDTGISLPDSGEPAIDSGGESVVDGDTGLLGDSGGTDSGIPGTVDTATVVADTAAGFDTGTPPPADSGSSASDTGEPIFVDTGISWPDSGVESDTAVADSGGEGSDTGAADTGAASSDTGSADTGAEPGETGNPDTADRDSSDTAATDTAASDTADGDSSDTAATDTAASDTGDSAPDTGDTSVDGGETGEGDSGLGQSEDPADSGGLAAPEEKEASGALCPIGTFAGGFGLWITFAVRRRRPR